MASMQAAMKDLRTLKQEETAMMNLASKISDQLNRLKVEELALQNLVRLQNEELERRSRGSRRSLPVGEAENDDISAMRTYLDKGDKSTKNAGNEGIVPVNLVVNNFRQYDEMTEEEEEEEDDEDEGEKDTLPGGSSTHDDIEQFVNSL